MRAFFNAPEAYINPFMKEVDIVPGLRFCYSFSCKISSTESKITWNIRRWDNTMKKTKGTADNIKGAMEDDTGIIRLWTFNNYLK